MFSVRGLERYPAVTVFFYALLFAALFWNVANTPLALLGQSLELYDWCLVVAIAVFGTLVPFGLFLLALQRLDPVGLTVTSTTEPLFAILLAWWFLNESLTPWQLLGSAFIIGSIVLMTQRTVSEPAKTV